MKLLGFRTNKTWKKVLSVLYLCLFLIVVVFFLLESKFENISTYDFIVDKLYGLYLMSMFLLPYIFLSDTKFRDKLPLFNNQKATSSALGLIIVVTILLIFSAFINGLHSDEYKADMKDHAFKKTVTTEATCEADGVIDCDCEYCGLHTIEVIKPTGHKMVEISESLLKCEVCGKEETIEQQTTETESAAAEEVTKSVEKTTEEPITEIETTTELVKISEPTSKTEIVTEVATTEKVDKMIQQFIDLGFTQSEAKEIKKIFVTVGITEISNIQAVGNAGIDKLQAFQCDIFESRRDKGGPSLLFTVEKRTLCHMSLNGFMNTNSLEYDSVVLYDIWNEDGTINYNAAGYKAVVDYEKGKINKY